MLLLYNNLTESSKGSEIPCQVRKLPVPVVILVQIWLITVNSSLEHSFKESVMKAGQYRGKSSERIDPVTTELERARSAKVGG